MYYEKMEPILEDLENKNIDVAGGSVVGMSLATINSLIIYIANLTLRKPKYEDVQDKVEEILLKANELKNASLEVIDKDKDVLENILEAYKNKKNDEGKYQEACKEATEFCMYVVDLAKNTITLAEDISKVGNKMLSSDFKICRHYAMASLHSAIENVHININSITDEQYKNDIKKKCNDLLSATIQG